MSGTVPLPFLPTPSATPPPSNSVGYVRGAGVELDLRRAVRVVAIVGIVLLAGLTVGFAVFGIQTVHRDDRLARHGVDVTVTVASCQAIASGTGVTTTGYVCQGAFSLDGRRHLTAIGGTTKRFRVGEQLAGVADPSNPSVLATSASVAAEPAAWEEFIIPAVTLVLMVVLAGWLLRRRRAQPSSASSHDQE